MPSASGFATAGLTTVLLPSGYRVRGTVPGLDLLVRRGLVDDRVLAAVVRLADPKWVEAAPEQEAAGNLRTWVDVLVAGFPREAQDPGADPETGEWKPVGLAVADLPNMDQRDRDLLEDLVMHRRTADEVTAAAQAALAATTGTETPDGEVEAVIDGLAEFRDDLGGAAGGAHGAGLGDPAVGAPGHDR